MKKKFNFKKFIVRSTSNKEPMLIIPESSTAARINLPAVTLMPEILKWERIDVFTDKENNAIKIAKGNSYKLIRSSKTKELTSVYFHCLSIVINEKLKYGMYKYVGDYTFVLEEN